MTWIEGEIRVKRLTDARRSRCFFCEAADAECAFAAGEFSAPCPDYRRYQRLAAIENILGDDYDLDRLKELVQADREGRCAVTPCKQGDIVYIITEPQNVKGLDLGDVPDTEYEKKRVFECIVGSITIWDGGSHIQIILLHNGERVAHYIQPKDFKNGVVHFNRENAEAVLQNHKDQEKLPEAYQHQIMSRFCRKD